MRLIKMKPEEVEQHKEYVRSGLLEMTAGLYLILLGVGMKLPKIPRVSLFFLLIIFFQLMRHKIILPKLEGYRMRYDLGLMSRIYNMVLMVLIVLLVALIILSQTGIYYVNQSVMHLASSVIVVILTGLAAQIIGAYRLMIYGAWTALIILFFGPIQSISSENQAIIGMMILPGVILTGYGGYLLTRFLRRMAASY